MDPDKALEEARAALAKAARAWDAGRGLERAEGLEELAEAFEALDGWLCKGGFLPAAWNAGRARVRRS